MELCPGLNKLCFHNILSHVLHAWCPGMSPGTSHAGHSNDEAITVSWPSPHLQVTTGPAGCPTRLWGGSSCIQVWISLPSLL